MGRRRRAPGRLRRPGRRQHDQEQPDQRRARRSSTPTRSRSRKKRSSSQLSGNKIANNTFSGNGYRRGEPFAGDVMLGGRPVQLGIDEQLRLGQHVHRGHLSRKHRRNLGLPEQNHPEPEPGFAAVEYLLELQEVSEHRTAEPQPEPPAQDNDAQPLRRGADQPAVPVRSRGKAALASTTTRRVEAIGAAALRLEGGGAVVCASAPGLPGVPEHGSDRRALRSCRSSRSSAPPARAARRRRAPPAARAAATAAARSAASHGPLGRHARLPAPRRPAAGPCSAHRPRPPSLRPSARASSSVVLSAILPAARSARARGRESSPARRARTRAWWRCCRRPTPRRRARPPSAAGGAAPGSPAARRAAAAARCRALPAPSAPRTGSARCARPAAAARRRRAPARPRRASPAGDRVPALRRRRSA